MRKFECIADEIIHKLAKLKSDDIHRAELCVFYNGIFFEDDIFQIGFNFFNNCFQIGFFKLKFGICNSGESCLVI